MFKSIEKAQKDFIEFTDVPLYSKERIECGYKKFQRLTYLQDLNNGMVVGCNNGMLSYRTIRSGNRKMSIAGDRVENIEVCVVGIGNRESISYLGERFICGCIGAIKYTIAGETIINDNFRGGQIVFLLDRDCFIRSISLRAL